MSNPKSQKTIYLVSISILIVSLVITLLDAFIPLNIWVHPILTFLFCLAVGFGILCVVLAFIKKSAWCFFVSSILLGLSFIYAFSCSLKSKWWISLIIVVIVWAILALSSIMHAGNKTEDISLNKSEEYKNYQQRKLEREQAEKEKQEEPLPEIKSFSDKK